MKISYRMTLISGLLAALFAPCASAAESTRTTDSRIELDRTVISGNQELPKVLYIVPWQTPEGRPELPIPAVIADDGLFRRLAPAAHQRELDFLNNLPGIAPKE